MNNQFNNRSYNMIKKTTLCFNETVQINLPIFSSSEISKCCGRASCGIVLHCNPVSVLHFQD